MQSPSENLLCIFNISGWDIYFLAIHFLFSLHAFSGNSSSPFAWKGWCKHSCWGLQKTRRWKKLAILKGSLARQLLILFFVWVVFVIVFNLKNIIISLEMTTRSKWSKRHQSSWILKRPSIVCDAVSPTVSPSVAFHNWKAPTYYCHKDQKSWAENKSMEPSAKRIFPNFNSKVLIKVERKPYNKRSWNYSTVAFGAPYYLCCLPKSSPSSQFLISGTHCSPPPEPHHHGFWFNYFGVDPKHWYIWALQVILSFLRTSLVVQW